jgi:hypothetical protein
MKTSLTLILGVLVVSLGCGEEPAPAPGEDGGECRIALIPCDEGLECRGGACLPAITEEQTPDITLLFDVGGGQAVADGDATLLVTLLANLASDGAPYEGEMLLHIDPPGAGELKPAVVSFDQGVAFTEYVTCERGRDRVCPPKVRLTAALLDTPLSPFAASERITLTDDEPDANDEP